MKEEGVGGMREVRFSESFIDAFYEEEIDTVVDGFSEAKGRSVQESCGEIWPFNSSHREIYYVRHFYLAILSWNLKNPMEELVFDFIKKFLYKSKKKEKRKIIRKHEIYKSEIFNCWKYVTKKRYKEQTTMEYQSIPSNDYEEVSLRGLPRKFSCSRKRPVETSLTG